MDEKVIPDSEKIARGIIAERDAAFNASFCREGKFMDDGGKEVTSITCSMDSREFLAFIHEYDQRIIEAANGRYE